MQRLLSDTLHSVRVWRVWLFLGLQDIKTRFRRSVVGPVWIFLNMFLFVAGAGVLYGVMINQPMREFLPFLTAGFSLWGFIATSLVEAAFAFVNAEGYIKQFCYPKQIYLMRVLVSASIVLLFCLATVIPVQLFFNNLSVVGWLFALPGLAILLLAGLGHIAVAAYLGVRFRDFPHAAGGLLQVAFFVTPVMFPAKVLADRGLSFVYAFNPFYYVLELVRQPILTGDLPSLQMYLVAALYVFLLWTAAAVIARSLDSRVVVLL